MNDVERTPPSARAVSLAALAAWLGLGAAAAFFLWVLGVEPGSVPAPETALGSYARSLLVGLAASGAVVGLGWPLGLAAWLARASYASCLLYAGFVTIVAGQSWPWLLLAGAMLLLVLLRRSDFSQAARPLLLVHAMGTLGALYACFRLPAFLAPWAAFHDVLRGLWLVLTAPWQ